MKRNFSISAPVALLVLVTAVGCHSHRTQPSASLAVSSLPEINGWTNWLQITPANYQVSQSLAVLCRPVPSIQVGTAGEHAKVPISVFVNPLAASQLTNQVRSKFPEGSIIVKAKYGADLDAPSELGIMLKRGAGYDNVGGNWEYAFVHLAGVPPIERGVISNCRDCHSAKKSRDFVFASGLSGSFKR